MKTKIKQLSAEELAALMKDMGQPSYRADQIVNWIYKKHAVSFDEMTDLSKAFRDELKLRTVMTNIELLKTERSKDGTYKFLFGLEDDETIESVLIPNKKEKGRFTLCISSQVGCALGCRFCMTGRLGLIRNLESYEIVDQVVSVNRFISQHPVMRHRVNDIEQRIHEKETNGEKPAISNLVFMGMGEPLNNFNEVVRALWKLTGPMGFSKRKITVSTAGIVPGIRKLPEKAPEVNLAVSLNAATDETRNRIMPVNRRYPLKELLQACRDYPLAPRRRITFEYVMLDGINDSMEDARRLVRLLKGIRSKINLIPFNPVDDLSGLRQPSDNRVLEFQDILRKAGLTAIIRKSMGGDISAACGQLKAKYGGRGTGPI